jgi:hypothetical protein
LQEYVSKDEIVGSKTNCKLKRIFIKGVGIIKVFFFKSITAKNPAKIRSRMEIKICH